MPQSAGTEVHLFFLFSHHAGATPGLPPPPALHRLRSGAPAHTPFQPRCASPRVAQVSHGERDPPRDHALQPTTAMSHVVVFTTSTPATTRQKSAIGRLKALLTAKKIAFEEVRIWEGLACCVLGPQLKVQTARVRWTSQSNPPRDGRRWWKQARVTGPCRSCMPTAR